VNGQATKVYLLADPKKSVLPFVQSGDTVSVKLPEIAKDTPATVMCIEVHEPHK